MNKNWNSLIKFHQWKGLEYRSFWKDKKRKLKKKKKGKTSSWFELINCFSDWFAEFL